MGEIRVLDTAGDTQREVVRLLDSLKERLEQGDVVGGYWCILTHDDAVDEDYANLTVPQANFMCDVLKDRLMDSVRHIIEPDDE